MSPSLQRAVAFSLEKWSWQGFGIFFFFCLFASHLDAGRAGRTDNNRIAYELYYANNNIISKGFRFHI